MADPVSLRDNDLRFRRVTWLLGLLESKAEAATSPAKNHGEKGARLFYDCRRFVLIALYYPGKEEIPTPLRHKA